MKSSIKCLVGIAIAAAFTVAAFASDAAPATSPGAGKTTVVLVHGAFADGSGWGEVIRLLQGRGLNVVAVQNPLTSLADDVAATRRVLDAQAGPVVLVGHSWGGVVISEAGVHERVKSLVYVAAFAPSEGQSVADLTKGYPTPPGSKFVVADQAGFLSLSPEGMAKHFAQDLPAAQTGLMTVTQVPIRASSFEEGTKAAAWRSRPTWYVLTQNDHMIDPGLQRAMARSMHAHVVSVASSHVPQLSRPVQVADAILSAAEQAK
ncbi:Pyrethroid hydrolase [Cupriavidus yeoncheonensis]|uniref:Pyrethroid hydrolase n=1 Tax=Cupriavidus yeoncheonensis TaxID=1462994 RepID=A0A916N033_9BURK|nr:alpha/beta hydrolase [Cupriavidus yeoncheonensis]CAG2155195.1 Pyrethroid hydrolase [Cupriavidus yeoncheonensis]